MPAFGEGKTGGQLLTTLKADNDDPVGCLFSYERRNIFTFYEIFTTKTFHNGFDLLCIKTIITAILLI